MTLIHTFMWLVVQLCRSALGLRKLMVHSAGIAHAESFLLSAPFQGRSVGLHEGRGKFTVKLKMTLRYINKVKIPSRHKDPIT